MTDHTLALKIDASKAKAGAEQFRGAIAGIKRAINDLDKDTNGVFTKLKAPARVRVDTKEVNTATSNIKAMDAELKRSQQTALASASAMRVAESQSSRLYEKLSRLGDNSGIGALNLALAKLEVNLQKAQTPLDVRVAKSAYQDLTAQLVLSNRQLEIQERNQNIANAAMRQTASIATTNAAALTQVTSAQKGLTAASILSSGAMRQTSFQLSQIAQQGLASGDILRAAAIQIPDLLLPFGTVAILAGTVIGALAPIGLSFIGASSKGKEFADRLESIKQLSTELTTQTDILSLSVVELSAKYGEAATRIRDLAVFQAELKIAELSAAMAEHGNILRSVSESYITSSESGRRYEKTLQRIQDDFGLTGDAAVRFEGLLQTAYTTTSLDAQAEALRSIAQLLRENGVEASTLPPEFRAATDQLIQMDAEVSAAKENASRLADSVSDVAPNLAPAVTTASALNAELGKSIALLNRIAQQESQTSSGRGGDPRDFMPGGSEYGRRNSDVNYGDTVDDLIEADKKRLAAIAKSSKGSVTKGSGSGGGGGARVAQLSDEAKAVVKLNDTIQDRLVSLEKERLALGYVASGMFATSEAADLYAQKMIEGKGKIDEQTAATIRRIDAESQLNDKLREASTVQGGSIQQAASESLQEGLKSGLSAALQGKTDNFAANLAATVRASIADALAERIVKGMGIENLFNSGGNAAAIAMNNAMVAGGAQAAGMIQASMTGAAIPAGSTGGSGGNALGIFSALRGIVGFSRGGYTGNLPTTAVAGVVHGQEGVLNARAMALPGAHGIMASMNAGKPAVLQAAAPAAQVGARMSAAQSGARGGASIRTGSIGENMQISIVSPDDQVDPVALAQQISATMREEILQTLQEQTAYGGMMNPRG